MERLIYDIVIRYPRDQIVLRADGYYVLSENKFTHKIPDHLIEDMVEKKFVSKNKHGGLILENEIYNVAENMKAPTAKIESKKEPGKFYDVTVSPDRWKP